MRLDDVGALPTVLSTEQAAELYGCSVDHLWALARSGAAPIEPLHLGRKLVWPTAAVLRSIGLDRDGAGARDPGAAKHDPVTTTERCPDGNAAR